MAMTLTSRETFLALSWIEAEPERREHFRKLASDLSRRYKDDAVPRLSDELLSSLQHALPALGNPWSQLMGSAISKINFYELSMALILESENPTEASTTA